MPDRRVAWLHCFAGVAGDMILGACLDAGVDLKHVISQVERLDLHDWSIEVDSVRRNGLAASAAVVRTSDHRHGRTLADVVAVVRAAGLDRRVEARAIAAFEALGVAEASVHGVAVETVHFHEVGADDALIDVVGSIVALDDLGIERLVVSPIAIGHGVTRSAHGAIPAPGPAVVELLRGLPAVGRDIGHELATPTGVAIVRSMADSFGPLPEMRIDASGYGAGSADFEGVSNVVQLVVGTEICVDAGADEQLVTLETNVDDVTGEVLAYCRDRLFDAGALDVWLTPTIMKKGRPGVIVSVLARPVDVVGLRRVLVAETGVFGVRTSAVGRWAAARSFDAVNVNESTIAIKRSADRVKAEFDDAANVAHAGSRPVREVLADAESAARAPEGDR